MAGQRPLKPFIKVRVLVPEQRRTTRVAPSTVNHIIAPCGPDVTGRFRGRNGFDGGIDGQVARRGTVLADLVNPSRHKSNANDNSYALPLRAVA